MKRLFVMGLLFMFMAVAPVVSLFAAEPEVATNSGPISSVTVAGLVAQNGTPTPTTPIDIVSNNGVVKASKNLFKTVDTTSSFYGITLTSATNGLVTAVGTATDNGGRNSVRLQSFTLPAGTYTVSFSGTKRSQLYLVAGNDSSAQNIITDVNGGTFTISESKTLHFGLNLKQGTTYNDSFYIQVEAGSTATPYHPYGEIYTDGEVETIADSANHTATVATLLGVGDYRDTQNINTGAITRNVGVKVLDGTEDWTGTTVRFSLNIEGSEKGGIGWIVVCSHYKGYTGYNPIAEMPDLSCKINQDARNLLLKDEKFNGDVTAFKSYLASEYAKGTPVIIMYPLATPTTESVTGQTMTTAPVNNRTGGVTGMTITTLLSSGASVVTTIANNAIKIATTAYNAARFSTVVTELNDTIATIRSVVTNTINQTKAIADLQATKQTRPDENCPAGKKCLLVETEENGVIVPHWFPIIEAPENTE